MPEMNIMSLDKRILGNYYIRLLIKAAKNPIAAFRHVFKLSFKWLSIITFLFSFLTPRNSNVWIFGYGGGWGYADNSKHLFEYVHENVGYIETVWVSSDKSIVVDLRDRGYNAHSKCSLKGIYYTLISKYGFITHSRQDICWGMSGGMIVTNLQHGIPFKKYRWVNDGEAKEKGILDYFVKKYITWNFEYTIASSKKYISPIAKAERVKPENILITGLPRNDDHFSEEKQIDIHNSNNQLVNKVKNSLHNQHIFYFPTWREKNHNTFEYINFSKLNNFLEDRDAYMTIVAHRNTTTLNIDQSFSNIVICQTDADFYPVLKHTDILITDYSSITYSALLHDLQIIYYIPDFEKYTQNRRFFFEYNTITPGIKVDEFHELLETLEKSLEDGHIDPYYDERSRLFNETYEYQDGCSCQRIVEYFESLDD